LIVISLFRCTSPFSPDTFRFPVAVRILGGQSRLCPCFLSFLFYSCRLLPSCWIARGPSCCLSVLCDVVVSSSVAVPVSRVCALPADPVLDLIGGDSGHVSVSLCLRRTRFGLHSYISYYSVVSRFLSVSVRRGSNLPSDNFAEHHISVGLLRCPFARYAPPQLIDEELLASSFCTLYSPGIADAKVALFFLGNCARSRLSRGPLF